MSEFLTTRGVSDRLEQIIKNANERLILISPYIKMHDHVKELLADQSRLPIEIDVVYGKERELDASESELLNSLSSVRTHFYKNLHAKCYLNENEALLTSMNLYEFSQANNHEMGVLISRTAEPKLHKEVFDEATRILRISEEIQVKGASVKPTQIADTKEGYCIRCGKVIALDPKKPYCKAHYRSWNRYKNYSYVEKHCHRCGEERKSTMSKPVCRRCRRKLPKT